MTPPHDDHDDHCDLLCLDLPLAERLRKGRPPVEETTAAARRIKALADPTRLTVAGVLAAGDELCVCDLSWVMERGESLVSHHLRVLRTEGLVTSRRDGKMVLYAITPAGRALLAAATETGVAAG